MKTVTLKTKMSPKMIMETHMTERTTVMHRRPLSVVGLEEFVNKQEYSTLRLLFQRPSRLTTNRVCQSR